MSSLKRMITSNVLLDFCKNTVGSVKGSPTPHSLLVIIHTSVVILRHEANAKERETEKKESSHQTLPMIKVLSETL
jgi:hypothetical protein